MPFSCKTAISPLTLIFPSKQIDAICFYSEFNQIHLFHFQTKFESGELHIDGINILKSVKCLHDSTFINSLK